MKKPMLIVATLGVLAMPASAGIPLDSRLDVFPTSQTTFEVIEANGAGPNQIWCAAASYSSRTLRKNSGRLYISMPRGASVTQPGRKAVGFSTEPIPGVTGRATNSISEVGANLRVGHAVQFCRDNIISRGDR